jgi:hypothetical protein
LQNGEHESGGLSGSRLGAGEYVAACEDSGNGLGLNGGGFGVALFVYSTQQLGLQPEIGK